MRDSGKDLRVALAAVCAYWIWALLAVPDHLLVLDRQIELPPLGPGIAAGVFFLAAPLAVLAAFVAFRFLNGIRLGPLSGAALSIALTVNALRCLKLHDPVLSYLTAGLVIGVTGIAAADLLTSGTIPRSGSRAVKGLIAGTLAVAAGLGLVGILLLVPWSLRGGLPGKMSLFPFGPALSSLLYADLSGHVRSAGASRRSLRGIRLEGADLRGAVLKGVDLRGAALFRARMDRADLEGADLRAAGLVEARLSFVNLRNADLSGADLSRIYSLGADLRGAALRGAGFHVQRFFYADGRGADFSSADLSSASFFWSDLSGAVFRNAKLLNATLIRTRLEGADLSRSTLTGADLCQARLGGAILEGADLSGASRLGPDNLVEVATLRGARIDPPLLDEMKRRRPDLF